ncbi:hypothetical protein BC834DRAFT_468719 [Gloeopeniophorella convolvens]|nr:hypothetical protein BC834DRAFT_468719 [Gloeopeniophorella convolvens]
MAKSHPRRRFRAKKGSLVEASMLGKRPPARASRMPLVPLFLSPDSHYNSAMPHLSMRASRVSCLIAIPITCATGCSYERPFVPIKTAQGFHNSREAEEFYLLSSLVTTLVIPPSNYPCGYISGAGAPWSRRLRTQRDPGAGQGRLGGSAVP